MSAKRERKGSEEKENTLSFNRGKKKQKDNERNEKRERKQRRRVNGMIEREKEFNRQEAKEKIRNCWKKLIDAYIDKSPPRTVIRKSSFKKKKFATPPHR